MPSAKDCVAVTGLIADCDTDKARNTPVPVPSTFEINSSPNNYHRAYVFTGAILHADAKAIAEQLKSASNSDNCTTDPVHLWRIDGTTNWPTYEKVHERGRSRKPFPVRITLANYRLTHEPAALRSALAQASNENARRAGGAGRGNGADSGDSAGRDAKTLYSSLPLGTQSLIRNPLPVGERSETTFAALLSMVRAGFTDEEIIAVVALYPEGPFERNPTEQSLRKEIHSARAKAAERQHGGYRPGAGRKAKAPLEATLVVRKASEIELKPLNWLWPNKIAGNKLTLLAGHPGLGKSLITIDLAARVTLGKSWPDNQGCAEPGNVIWLSAEDNFEDTTGPRFKAAEADFTRIHEIVMVQEKQENGALSPRGFDLQQDIERLETLIKTTSARLVIIDPVSAYMGKPGSLDSYRQTDVRAVLAPLAALAGQQQVAILLITHLTKKAGAEAIHRVTGSGAFVAVRTAFLVEEDESPGAPLGQRLMLPLKNNLAGDGGGLSYRLFVKTLPGLGDVPYVEWGPEPVTITADQALANKVQPSPRRRGNRYDDAVDLLFALLKTGPKEKAVIEAEANRRGISDRQLHNARRDLFVIVKTVGFPAKSVWQLPDAELPF
jgi:hypothetical protein